MIVNSLEDGWEVIYQRSHALLAAMLVDAWRTKDHSPRWTEVLIAIAQHDDQEMYWQESSHLTDLGAPLDFTQGSLDTTKKQAQYVIENAYQQGLWIALLISRHNSFLYEPLRGKNEELDAFLDQQRDNQETWRKALTYTEEEVDRAYSFVRWGDRLSLILCRRQLPARDRWLDVAPAPDGTIIRVQERDEGGIVDPWIFQEDEVQVSVEVRRLRQLKFETEEEFRNAMEQADVEERFWTFRRT